MQLPLHQRRKFIISNKTPDSKYTHPIYYYPGPQSEPATKHTASPVMVFSAHIDPRFVDSASEFHTLIRHAIAPLRLLDQQTEIVRSSSEISITTGKVLNFVHERDYGRSDSIGR